MTVPFWRRKRNNELEEEISAHLELSVRERMERGASLGDAADAAHREFGNAELVKDVTRDAWGWTWLEHFAADLRFALRTLRSNPAFAIVAIFSLAVGIGANTVIFSLVNSVLLRPRPVSNPEQLVELYAGDHQQPFQTCSYPSYVEFRERNEVFTGLAAYSIRQFKLGDANQVEQVWGEVVSGNYFDVLGVQPYRGRAFTAEEDFMPGGDPVVVIGHALWQRRFNSDPTLVGRAITINWHKLTVVGVAPPQYTGIMRGLASEVWIPATMLPVLEPSKGQSLLTHRGSKWLTLLGRLKPGTTIEQAKARFDLLSREMQAIHPEEWRPKHEASGQVRELFVTVVPEREGRIHPSMKMDVYALVAALMVIVNLVLLIACMNLAGMLLARAVARRKQVAIQMALGAGRLRIMRQLITESVVLSWIAGGVGLLLTVWLLGLLLAYMPAFPEGIRVAFDLHLDWRVFAYTFGFSTVTGILFGLAPAFQSSKSDVSTVMKDDSGTIAGSYCKSRIRGALVGIQVAFSLLLLISAGLVLRSLEKIRPTSLGFDSDNMLVASLSLDEEQYDRAKSQQFYRRLSDHVSALPGVEAVSLVEGMPGGFMSRSRRTTEIEGYEPGPDESLHIDSSFVGPNYFSNMKTPIVQGRDFNDRDRDGAPCVAIINEAFARRYFAAAVPPLGKHLAKFEGGRQPVKHMCEIVGVVRDDRWQSLQKTPWPFYALALYQSHRTRMTLLVNTKGDPAGHTLAVRRALHELDPNMPANDVSTLLENFSATVYPFRLLGVVIGACGVMALLLASVGIYGIVSYSVAQRTREVGIRIALGALKSDVLKRMVGAGMVPVAWGLTLGLLLSVALTRVLASSLFESELLFGVSATDAITFAGVTFVLTLVALIACFVPALRATKVHPIEALRYE